MNETDRGPLAETLTRLDAADAYFRYVAGEPNGDGWHRLDEVLADEWLFDDWYWVILRGPARGKRDVAGSYLASWLGRAVIDTAAVALVAERRTWPVRDTNIAIHRHDMGWFDGIAVLAPEIRLLRTDPAAGHRHAAAFEGVDQLRSALIDETIEIAGRLFTEVRARAPYGIRGMWGALADELAAGLMRAARDTRCDEDRAWQEASALLDVLAERVEVSFARPHLDRTEWSGGCTPFTVRGTCCLYYKTVDGNLDRRGEHYCTTCPLSDEGWRRQRMAAWLEEHQTER